jgi:GTP-binding protein
VFDLFVDLHANDRQMDFQIVYASGMNGIAGFDPNNLQVTIDAVLSLLVQFG